MNLSNPFALAVLFAAGMLISCSGEEMADLAPGEEMETAPRSVYGTNSVDFDYSNQRYYTSMAESDFGDLISSWKSSRAYIINETLKVTMLKNELTGAGGLIAKFDISNGPSYEVSYKVRFYPGFDFSKGGKLGFGFGIGDGNTGCDKADDGNGGSARMMWYNNGSTVKFKPYLYYTDMTTNCGTNIYGSAVYPANGSISDNTWYTIKMRVKSNTSDNYNGSIKIKVNGTTILDKDDIRWAINDNKRWINDLLFTTFRGGSDESWYSSEDSYIYYDDVEIIKDPQSPF